MNESQDYAQILAYISKLEKEVAALRRELARDPGEVVEERRKTCATCGETRPLLDFNNLASGVFQRQRNCKFCMTKSQSKYLGDGVAKVRGSLGIPARFITAELFALKSDQLAAKKMAKQIQEHLKDVKDVKEVEA